MHSKVDEKGMLSKSEYVAIFQGGRIQKRYPGWGVECQTGCTCRGAVENLLV